MDFLSTPLPQSCGSEETVEKRNIAWNAGMCHLSDDARKRISAARKYTTTPEETKAKRRNTMITRYGKMATNNSTHYFEGLPCKDWLDANRELVETLSYHTKRGVERRKVIDHMITLCPTATRQYLAVAICHWSKKQVDNT
jgi:hypothetical protein